MKKLILASSSPTRAWLLKQIGYDFEVIPSSYQEDMTQKLPAEKLIALLAEGKAQNVADSLSEGVVLGADSFIELEGEYIGKPHTKERAVEVLRRLSCNTNIAYTGFAIIDVASGKKVTEVRSCKVTFRKLTETEIKAYVNTEEPLLKGGGYAITMKAAAFIDHIEGDLYAVVGLPVSRISVLLKGFGVPLPW